MVLCLREKLLDNLPPSFEKPYIILLSCDYCRMCQKFEKPFFEQRKELSLLIAPLFVIARCKCEPHVLFRTMMIAMLEEMQKMFRKSVDENELPDFIAAFNSYIKDRTNEYKNESLVNLFKNINETNYIELLKHIIFEQDYDLALGIVLMYISINVSFSGHGFRIYYHYRDFAIPRPQNIILDIGFSMDEGLAEGLTQEMMNADEVNIDKSMYYLEVKFFKRMCDAFGKEELIKLGFGGEGYISFLHDKYLKTDNRCDFYDLYNLTDNHEWGAALKLLSKIKGAIQ